MPITQDQFDEDIARLQENMNNAQGRAADWRAQGREDRAATWDASAERYSRLIDIKIKLFESSKKVQAIKDKLATPEPAPQPRPGVVVPPEKVVPPPKPDTNRNPGGSAPAPVNPPSQPPVPVKPPPPPPPPPAPDLVVKTAPLDTVLFNEDPVDFNIIADLLFENVGGQEILSIARYDTVNGQDVVYQPIKNLNLIQQEYNPNNLIRIQQTTETIFSNFPIKLNDKIPNIGNGPNGENVYLDDNGAIVIEFVNLETDEQVEVQISTDGTIYEVGI